MMSKPYTSSLKFFKKHFYAATVLSATNLLGIIASTLQPVQAIVIGQDNRVTPSYTWLTRPKQQRTAVGRLEVQRADGKFNLCTFTVVGRNIGLTNTHCLLDEKSGLPRQIKAFAVKHGNRVFAAANVDLFWLGMDAQPKTVGEGVRDWAIIRFTSNLGDTTGWFGNLGWSTNVNNGGQGLFNQITNYIGYPTDWPTNATFKSGDVRGQTPALHAGCKIVDVQIGLLLHNCDTNPGASGSSLYGVFSDTDLRIMGLHRGSVKVNSSEINVAVPLERFMPALNKLRETGASADTRVPRP